jgi:hypothetical protein
MLHNKLHNIFADTTNLAWTKVDAHSLIFKAFLAIEPTGAAVDGGEGWIRTNVGLANGFTVRPL